MADETTQDQLSTGESDPRAVQKKKKKRKRNISGLSLTRLRHSIKDAKKVNRAARQHHLILTDIGVDPADFDEHSKNILMVEGLLKRHGANKKKEGKEVEARDALLQQVVDLIAGVTRKADLEFNDSRPAGKKDKEAMAAFGVGQGVPQTLDDIKSAIDAITSALEKPEWRKAIAKRKVTPATVKEIEARWSEASAAETGKSSAVTGRRGATSALTNPAAEMRRLTSYFRKAGNDQFKGKEDLKDFDPPPRPRVKKRKPADKGAQKTSKKKSRKK